MRKSLSPAGQVMSWEIFWICSEKKRQCWSWNRLILLMWMRTWLPETRLSIFRREKRTDLFLCRIRTLRQTWSTSALRIIQPALYLTGRHYRHGWIMPTKWMPSSCLMPHMRHLLKKMTSPTVFLKSRKREPVPLKFALCLRPRALQEHAADIQSFQKNCFAAEWVWTRCG